MSRVTGLGLAVVCAIAGAIPAAAADVSFAGKRIDVIMGSAPGGGTDGTTRLVGRYLEKYLPGKPDMQYRNLPGGHGTKAINYFAESVPPDGLSWLGGSSAHIDANNLQKPTTKYDPTKFAFFGGVSRGGSIIFVNSAKAKNLTDSSLPPVVVGELDGSRSWANMIMFGQEALGWNIRFVIGYPGTSHLLLAVNRGEVDMTGTSNLKLLQEMLRSGKFKGVAQMGTPGADGEVKGRSDFPDVPVFDDLVEGKFKGVAKEAFEFWTMQNQMDKWYALPPGASPEILAAYRQAYDKVIKDKDFLKNAYVQFSEDFSPLRGPFVEKLVAKTSYPPKKITDFIDQMKLKNDLPTESLSDEEIAALAKKMGFDKMPSIKTTLKAVENGGRGVTFVADGKEHTAEISGSRTKVTIAGKEAKRAALKPGLQCEVSYPGDGQEATAIACR